MAFPTVVNTANTALVNTAANPVTMPASIVAGRLLLAQCAAASFFVPTPSAGWTTLVLNTQGSGRRQAAYAKIAAGGDSLTVTYSGADFLSAITYQIDNWSGSISDLVSASALSTMDPPSVTMGANADNLWIAACYNNASISAAPTNYSSFITQSYGGGMVATAVRTLTAATEDPGVFGGTSTDPSVWTIGVAPASGGGGSTTVPPQPVVMPSMAAHQAASW